MEFVSARRRLERVKGIEPSSSAWKAVALPLSYTRKLDFRLRSCRPAFPFTFHRAPIQIPQSQIRNQSVFISNWGVQDSNLRRHKPSDLQSDPFDRFGNPPRHLRRLIAPHGGLTRPRPSDTWQATRGRQRRRSLWRAVRPIDPKPAALFTYYELAGGLEPSTC